MKLLTLAPTTLLAVLVLAGCTSDAAKARDALVEGKRLAARSSLDDAATQLSEATRLDPQLHEAFARLARVRLGQHRAAEAEAVALRATVLVPQSAYYAELLGRSQLAGEKVDVAITSFERSMRLDSARTARNAFTIGLIRERQGKSVEAHSAFELSAARDAAFAAPRLALARLQLEHGSVSEARRWIDAARPNVAAQGAERAYFASLEARLQATLALQAAEAAARGTEPSVYFRSEITAAGEQMLLDALANDPGALDAILRGASTNDSDAAPGTPLPAAHRGGHLGAAHGAGGDSKTDGASSVRAQ